VTAWSGDRCRGWGRIISRTSRRLILGTSVLAALPLTSCEEGPTELYCDICEVRTEVQGTVRTSDGAPVPGTHIQVVPRQHTHASPNPPVGDCALPWPVSPVRMTSTDSRGEFRLILTDMSIVSAGRLIVTATPPGSSGLGPVVDTINPASWDHRPGLTPVTQLTLVVTTAP
jgi:hypothetical protein